METVSEKWLVKWKRYHEMKKSSLLAPHLPETHKLNEESFGDLLRRYGEIIVKPDKGRRGRGVIKIKDQSQGKYEIHYEDQKLNLTTTKNAFRFIKQKIGEEQYLVQQRIPLLTIDGRVMDFRVIVQRKSYDDPWEMTAAVAKLGGKGYIVTNVARSGGEVLLIDEVLERCSTLDQSNQTLLSSMKQVVLQAAPIITKAYPSQRIYGFDIGVDGDGGIWILEANLDPMLSHFRKLKDQTFYKRIKEYKRI